MSKINFEPVSDTLLIEPIRKNETTGGLALPAGAEIGPPRGRVVKAGPGRTTDFGAEIPMPVTEGDVVVLALINPPGEMEFGGKKYLIVRARDVLAKAPLDPSETLGVAPA